MKGGFNNPPNLSTPVGTTTYLSRFNEGGVQ